MNIFFIFFYVIRLEIICISCVRIVCFVYGIVVSFMEIFFKKDKEVRILVFVYLTLVGRYVINYSLR